MRQFVAGLCCAIVGLEVLVAVPLVTCLVMFALFAGGEMSPVAMQVHAASVPTDFPCTVPCPEPPLYAAPPMTTPVSIPALSFPQPATCPPPSTVSEPYPPLSSALDAIAEARQRIGSPLAETAVLPPPVSPRIAADDFLTAVERLATEESSAIVCPPQAPAADRPAVRALQPRHANGIGNFPTGAASLAGSLEAAAHGLYASAQDLEVAGDFAGSDKLRRLAREIHTQIDALRRESSSTLPAPTPITTTTRFPNPYLPVPDDSSAAPSSLVPTQAQLVPQTALPADAVIVPATSIIPEEPDDMVILLGKPEKQAENPAP